LIGSANCHRTDNLIGSANCHSIDHLTIKWSLQWQFALPIKCSVL
jgi:hypothetical protein